jgi:hypothetical protein
MKLVVQKIKLDNKTIVDRIRHDKLLYIMSLFFIRQTVRCLIMSNEENQNNSAGKTNYFTCRISL